MLLSPRRIPDRYNRRTSSPMRDFVKRRNMRRRQYLWERWRRLLHGLKRSIEQINRSIRQFALAFVIGLFLLIVGLLLFSPILDVREIRVLRTDPRIDVEQVQHALVPLFRKHLLILSAQDIVPMLRAALPDMISATIRKRYPSTLVVQLMLDPIIARLSIEDQGVTVPTATGAMIHTDDFLTAQGMYVTYLQSQIKDVPPALIRVVDWGARPGAWAPLVDPSFLLEMRQAEQTLLEQFSQATIERTVFLRAQEFHLKTKTYTLWFDRKSALDTQMQHYRIFLQAVGPQAAKEYVDLRLADRVVYK